MREGHAKILGHAHFCSFYGIADHGYGKWSSSSVETVDDKGSVEAGACKQMEGKLI